MTAGFKAKLDKVPHIETAIKRTDALKILLMILWESKSLDNNKYIILSEKIDEIGRMLGGWKGKTLEQNSPDKKAGEK